MCLTANIETKKSVAHPTVDRMLPLPHLRPMSIVPRLGNCTWKEEICLSPLKGFRLGGA